VASDCAINSALPKASATLTWIQPVTHKTSKLCIISQQQSKRQLSPWFVIALSSVHYTGLSSKQNTILNFLLCFVMQTADKLAVEELDAPARMQGPGSTQQQWQQQ